jgi:lysozyme
MAIKTKHKVAGAVVALPAAVAGLAAVFIPHWEGMDLTVKHFSFDPAGVYTVCNGITNLDPDYAWIRPGMKFTSAQCSEAFQKVLPKYYGPLTICIPSLATMPPHRQTAILSGGYNLGPARICNGDVARYLNAGNIKAGCEAMGAYIKAAGKVLQGLKNRRFDPKWGEIAWCLRED